MRAHLLGLALAASLAAAPLFGQPALTGPEFFVDPGTPGTQFAVSAASNSSGDQVAVWVEQSLVAPGQPRARVRGRRFDSSGAQLGPAFTVQPTSLKTRQWYPDVAIDPSGRFVVVWHTGDSEKGGSIQGRRFDASGHPVGDSFVVSKDKTPGVAPRVAVHAAGGFVVVWTRLGTSSTGSQILARRYAASGRPLGSPFGVDPENSPLIRSNPDVEAQPGGDFAITWAEFDRAQRRSRLRVRAFDRTGTPVGPVGDLSVLSRRSSWAASLAPAPGGGWIAVWAGGFKENVGYRIFGQSIGPDGGLAGAAFQIGTSNAGSFEHPHPQVAFDGDRSFFAVWPISVIGPAIRGRHFGPAGELLGPERIVHDPGFSHFVPVVASSGSGAFTVFWTGYHQGEFFEDRPLIAAQRLVASGGPGTIRLDQAVLAVPEGSEAPVELQVQRRDGTSGAVHVEIRLEGAASGSWPIDFEDGDSLPRTISIPVPAAVDHDDRIVVSLVDPTGGAVLDEPRQTVVEVRDLDVPSPLIAQAGPTIRVARTFPPLSQSDPSVASDAAGGFIVSWLRRNDDNGSLVVAGARYEASGALATHFESDSYPSTGGRPLLAVEPDGGFVQAWNEFYRARSHGQRRAPAGAPLGPAFSFGPVVPLALAPAPGGFWWAVTDGRDSAGTGLFLHRYRGGGIAAGPAVQVSGPILMQPPQADLAADAQGNLVAVWTVPPSGDGPGGIYARLFRASGEPRGPAFLVGTGGFGFDARPAVAMAAGGDFVVAWQRFDFDNRLDVFARSFDASGAPRSGDIPVNSNIVGFQVSPAVAVQDDGRFLVVWEDWHIEGWSEAPRGHYFDAMGMRLGGELKIAPRGRHVDVSTNGAGLFVVVWEGSTSAPASFIATRRFPAPP